MPFKTAYTDPALDNFVPVAAVRRAIAHDLDRVRALRWTHQTQIALHPGSLGFQYQAEQADIQIVF